MSAIPTSVREAVERRSQRRCERCGSARARHIHHRQPRGFGSKGRGPHALSNLLHLCVTCHEQIEERKDINELTKDGFLVSRHLGLGSAAQVPVLYRGRSVFLGDGGEVTGVP